MQNFRARRETLRKTNVNMTFSIFYFLKFVFLKKLMVTFWALKSNQVRAVDSVRRHACGYGGRHRGDRRDQGQGEKEHTEGLVPGGGGGGRRVGAQPIIW